MRPPAAYENDPIRDPWVTCFLANMLIQSVDDLGGNAAPVDYHRVIGVVEGFEHIRDPKAFLQDPNNWVPHAVLRECIRRCEIASGLKDITYRAALAYFGFPEGRQPAMIDTIVRFLDGVEAVIRCAGQWAMAYTTYLDMQAFARLDEPHTQHILVRFRPPVDPLIGNILFVKGNYEGFVKRYPYVDSVLCEEQYSQLCLSSIVEEFGDHYVVQQDKGKAEVSRVIIKERASGRVIVSALPWSLGVEPVEGWLDQQALACDRQATGSYEARLLRIEKGGVLRAGKLEYAFQEGALYNAPYTRYRFQWTGREQRVNEAHSRDEILRLLFENLRGFQRTQQRTLGVLVRNRALNEENTQLREELYGRTETGGMIGKSRPFQELLAMVYTVARTDATVLLTGETGTGKERTARLIHHLSPRREGRFLAVNCGALAENLLESELFGHERGSFTGAMAQKKGKFEQADGGTLFLDEIGEVSSSMQVKLLRVLQEREFQRVGGQEDITVDVRIIAATNQDLQSLVAERKFRQDLFYRLSVFPIHLPSLRERADDIPLIAEHLLTKQAATKKAHVAELTPEALQLMVKYQWPGNIRELENVIERAIALAGQNASLIGVDLLPVAVREAHTPITVAGFDELVKRVEWPVIVQSLKNNQGITGLLQRIEWALIRRATHELGSKSQAAKILGRTYRWLRKAETEMPQE